ncbi:hypothetical protein B0H67DRAFT_559321 [Lasiosphaeris hirsuta]|uniref:SNF2 N-terminal domain-containing protein n=1 Tax=Lasiosphaeris hirsuta TaxID=260670 RepID=A0AA40B8K9_9PEZI|nr:hypothetical protein B0H67DRAFT_559321 [Lasiosphaeris hirsuta]
MKLRMLRLTNRFASGVGNSGYQRGGIIADVMGLGKTLTVLAAILRTLPSAKFSGIMGNGPHSQPQYKVRIRSTCHHLLAGRSNVRRSPSFGSARLPKGTLGRTRTNTNANRHGDSVVAGAPISLRPILSAELNLGGSLHAPPKNIRRPIASRRIAGTRKDTIRTSTAQSLMAVVPGVVSCHPGAMEAPSEVFQGRYFAGLRRPRLGLCSINMTTRRTNTSIRVQGHAACLGY